MEKKEKPAGRERPGGESRPDEFEGSDVAPVVLEVGDILDLHSFQPRDIPELVEAYLEEALRKGFSTVRIIHGKGIGVQRERVHAVLRRTPFVDHFQIAPEGAGSWGATIVWFRPGSRFPDLRPPTPQDEDQDMDDSQ